MKLACFWHCDFIVPCPHPCERVRCCMPEIMRVTRKKSGQIKKLRQNSAWLWSFSIAPGIIYDLKWSVNMFERKKKINALLSSARIGSLYPGRHPSASNSKFFSDLRILRELRVLRELREKNENEITEDSGKSKFIRRNIQREMDSLGDEVNPRNTFWELIFLPQLRVNGIFDCGSKPHQNNSRNGHRTVLCAPIARKMFILCWEKLL